MSKRERRADPGVLRRLRELEADREAWRDLPRRLSAAPALEEPGWVSGIMRQVAENVRRDGWHATGTHAEDGTPYVYTAGLTGTFGHPELVIAGIGYQAAHGVLQAAADKVRGGAVLEPGTPYEGIAAGFVVRFADVFRPACSLSLAVTNRYYGRSVPFRQLVWPDPRGRFPGEPGCDEAMAAVQDICGARHG